MATWQSCQEKRKTRRLKSSFTGKALKAKTITVFPHTQFQVSNSIPAFKQTVMTTSCKTRDQEDVIHWRYLWSSWQAREDWWYKSNITWFLDGKPLKNNTMKKRLASRPGGVAVLLAMLHDKETVINSSCFGPLANVRFYILPFTCCK